MTPEVAFLPALVWKFTNPRNGCILNELRIRRIIMEIKGSRIGGQNAMVKNVKDNCNNPLRWKRGYIDNMMLKKKLAVSFLIISLGFLRLPCHAENIADIALPEIGNLVLYKNHKPADWLKEKYQGKRLLTPINFLIIDSKSTTAEQSTLFIAKYCGQIGFIPRVGHYSEYVALIGGTYYRQIPNRWKTAFSNKPFWKDNITFRLFGPGNNESGFIYSGSAMEESFSIIGPVYHKYISYNNALSRIKRTFMNSGIIEYLGSFEVKRNFDIENDSVGDDRGFIEIFTVN
jgi:hypothetical protein